MLYYTDCRDDSDHSYYVASNDVQTCKTQHTDIASYETILMKDSQMSTTQQHAKGEKDLVKMEENPCYLTVSSS